MTTKKVLVPLLVWVGVSPRDARHCTETTCALHEGGYCALWWTDAGLADAKVAQRRRWHAVYDRHPACRKAEVEARMLLAFDRRRKR